MFICTFYVEILFSILLCNRKDIWHAQIQQCASCIGTLSLFDAITTLHLRSAGCHQLFIAQRSMIGRRAFTVASLDLITRLPARSVMFH